MNGESFLVEYGLTGLAQRIVNRDEIQDNSLTPYNVPNILMYGSPSVSLYTRVTNFYQVGPLPRTASAHLTSP